MIRQGEDVRIVDNNSKEDLTSITLAQIIFEEEKKQKSFLPLQAMRNIIQSGGERIEELVSSAGRKVTGVFRRGDKDGMPAAQGSSPEASPPARGVDGDGAGELKEEGARMFRELREWIEHSQRTIDDWQRKVDERVRHVVEGISPFSSLQKEVGALGTRIAELEKKLEQLAKDEQGGG
jgi:polyhydroxyalkanoate synthesis regulator protein